MLLGLSARMLRPLHCRAKDAGEWASAYLQHRAVTVEEAEPRGKSLVLSNLVGDT